MEHMGRCPKFCPGARSRPRLLLQIGISVRITRWDIEQDGCWRSVPLTPQPSLFHSVVQPGLGMSSTRSWVPLSILGPLVKTITGQLFIRHHLNVRNRPGFGLPSTGVMLA